MLATMLTASSRLVRPKNQGGDRLFRARQTETRCYGVDALNLVVAV